jgi:hypothetical protein
MRTTSVRRPERSVDGRIDRPVRSIHVSSVVGARLLRVRHALTEPFADQQHDAGVQMCSPASSRTRRTAPCRCRSAGRAAARLRDWLLRPRRLVDVTRSPRVRSCSVACAHLRHSVPSRASSDHRDARSHRAARATANRPPAHRSVVEPRAVALWPAALLLLRQAPFPAPLGLVFRRRLGRTASARRCWSVGRSRDCAADRDGCRTRAPARRGA